ncbi:prepilin-type N-terminal cleavage/methylation domain-containing protein [Geoalkalibacter subterraneus]|uniref:Type II secretion system protein GspG C-terminal domain-containing protein n=1 Tax=Geoalkalibacter subterraneus TaxID=483547 RepID=A0A0B5FWY3_9BACT|nr:prepilin-type N-terminal cleavage/methylation domain-containing protein [Geoalkalibacter subterraneus]AJF08111.1 hypothetical protein GSUB_16500 [Geoalkalibacter subterraneus]
MKKTQEKGFTLVEIVVAIALVLLAAAIVVPMLFKHIDREKVASVNAEVLSLRAAVKAAILRDGGLKDNNGDGNFLDDLVDTDYLDRAPKSLPGATWLLKQTTHTSGRKVFYLDIECPDAECVKVAQELDLMVDEESGESSGNIQWALGS